MKGMILIEGKIPVPSIGGQHIPIKDCTHWPARDCITLPGGKKKPKQQHSRWFSKALPCAYMLSPSSGP